MDDYRFDCPTCAQHIAVNAGMQEAIVEHGCPVCGETVTPDAFTEAAATQQTNR